MGACVLTVSAKQNVTALFALARNLALHINGNGQISESGNLICGGYDCSQSYALGSTITLKARRIVPPITNGIHLNSVKSVSIRGRMPI